MNRSFSRIAVLVALGALSGCGGGASPPAESPPSGAQIADSGDTALQAEEAFDLSPVAAPAELIAVGRWSKPGATADTLMAWTNLPFDWRRLLQAKEPELSAVVALDAPLDAAVALAPDPAKRFEQPYAVFSLGLNSLDQALDFIRNKGESLRKVSPGVYVIRRRPALLCRGRLGGSHPGTPGLWRASCRRGGVAAVRHPRPSERRARWG